MTLYDGDERRELDPAVSAGPRDPAAFAGITRVVLAGDAAVVAAAAPRTRRILGAHRIRVERAGGGTVAVLPASADKGEGLRLVAAHLGVPLARVVACGDSAADESLLRAAAIGIAVGAAPASLRAAAQLVVSQGDLADALRRAVASSGLTGRRRMRRAATAAARRLREGGGACAPPPLRHRVALSAGQSTFGSLAIDAAIASSGWS